MANIETVRKGLESLNNIDQMLIDMSKQNESVYSKDFLDIWKIYTRRCGTIFESSKAAISEIAAANVEAGNSMEKPKPAIRNNRTISLPFDLGKGVSSAKKINILSDIRLPTNNHRIAWCENQENFVSVERIGASAEVEFQQTNNDSGNENNDEMETDNSIEFLQDDDQLNDDGTDYADNGQNVSTNHNGTYTSNESFVWENEQHFSEEEYDDNERYCSVTRLCTLQQITSSATATYIQYGICTESGDLIPEMVQTNENVYSDITPDDHKRSLVLEAIGQMENDTGLQEQICEKNFDQNTTSTSIQSDDITQSGDITTTADFHMDIQAEVNVETTVTNASDVDGPMIPSRPKRKRKVAPAYESFMKEQNGRNRSNVKSTTKPTAASHASKTSNVLEQVPDVKQADCKLAKAKEKKSAARKTICSTRPKILDSNDKTDEATNVLTISSDKQSSADAKWANAKRKRQSTARKTISGATSQSRPEILLIDIKKRKNKTDTKETIANEKSPATAKLEKAKEKRQSATRKTISCPRPKIVTSGNDNNDNLADADTDNKLPMGKVPTKAMKKWHPRRNTVSYDQSKIPNDDDDEDANATPFMGKNTNRDMHGKNPLYALCIYCKIKFNGSTVQHYVKSHPDREIPISRLSSRMAEQLKKQDEIFQKGDARKIIGLCYFCEEEKMCSTKFGWQTHLITHTGEKMFNCTACHAQMKTRREHDSKACKASVVNVFETKEDGSLVGFMCNSCNYFQFSCGRLIEHLKNEHGFEGPSKPHHFKEYKMVPGLPHP